MLVEQTLQKILDERSIDVFGFHPTKSSIQFTETRNHYSPRQLLTLINENSGDLVAVGAHEYLGHGIFCEHSRIGRELVKQDQKVAVLERSSKNLSFTRNT